MDLTSGPVDDVKFVQFLAVLSGEMICLESCPLSQLAMRLTPKDQFDASPVIVPLVSPGKNPKRATFSFHSVSPGIHDLEVVVVTGDTIQPAANWCWATPGYLRRITVVDRDLHNTPELKFQQTGYRLHLEANLLDLGYTKPIDLIVTPLVVSGNTSVAGKPLFYRLTNPMSTICLPSGSYTFEASTPCLRLQPPAPHFIQSVDVEIPPSPPRLIAISVKEMPVNVVVTALSGVEGFSDEKSLPDLTIQAHVRQSLTKLSARYALLSFLLTYVREGALFKLILHFSWKKEGDIFVSRVIFWAAPGDEVLFSVSPSLPPSEKDIVHPLITPPSKTVKVFPIDHRSSQLTYDGHELEPLTSSAASKLDETDCDAALAAAFGNSDQITATFSMKLGIFFKGTVHPRVDKALVSVFADTSVVSSPPLEATPDMTAIFSEQQLNPPSPKPGHSLVVRTLTNSHGTFRIGPFYFDKKSASTAPPSTFLTLHLHKPGFEFAVKSPTDWLIFTSQKLALVEIRVASEDEGKPLPGRPMLFSYSPRFRYSRFYHRKCVSRQQDFGLSRNC